MITELFKKHTLWVRMATGICKDPYLAQDIVQDMYLKFIDYSKEINDWYIYYALKHIFINYIRDDEKRFKAEVRHYHLYKEVINEEEEKKEVPDIFTWVEKQILIHRYDKSCRDIEKEFNINFIKVHRIETKAKEKIKLWEEKRKLKD